MTTTIDQFANVPMPAGATWLGEWKRSPNGQAIRRSFRTAEFPITGSQIVVVAGGHQFVDNDRSPFILRTVAIAAAPDGTPLAVDRAHTLKLSDALEEAAAHIADLEDADTGLEVTQMTATHDTTADVPTPAGAEHVGPWVDGIREFDGTRRGENVHVDLGGNQWPDGAIARHIIVETARGERRGVVILDADQAREAAGDLLAAADEIERLERLDEDEMADD